VTLTDPGAEAAARIRSTLERLERQAARAAPPHALEGFFEVLDRIDELTAGR
jgi:hypothetical protein